MRLIYTLGIRIYYLLILIASPINPKARLWIKGQRGLMKAILSETDPSTAMIWFHCSSLGEFEQGRPVMETIRKEFPEKKILLTFYSPSGYEVRKNYEGADHVFYLPLDTGRNARRFLNHMNIEKAYFVKYEFWYHFISGLHSRHIPLYLVSGIFRENQVFFKWYGKWYRRMLGKFTLLFLQQETSMELLKSIGISNTVLTGDTRFDRVNDIAGNVSPDRRFTDFCGESFVFVAGSTWPEDEEILTRYINESDADQKWVIAPHDIHQNEIERLAGQINGKSQRYTSLEESELPGTRVLIIDAVGLLSSLYQYAHVTYIGGGFGKGIHNTLEAATFGKPVIFGPHYRKFQEAEDLVAEQAAFPISSFAEFRDAAERLQSDPILLKTSSESARDYVKSRLGASRQIVDFTFKTNVK